MRKLQVKGDLTKALKYLQNDQNNAVAKIIALDINNHSNSQINGAIATIKDNYAIKGYETKASSLILESFDPGYDATIVQKLKEAGVNLVAKTHLDELSLGGTGAHSAYGIVKNPNDQTRYVGGSSSGSAATLTKDISFSIGSDTGDSVRLPASFVNRVGFKPSYGAISRYGLFAYASSLDTVAYFAHNVNDAILVSQVLYGIDSNDMTSKEVLIKNVIKTKPKTVVFLDLTDQVEDYYKVSCHQLIAKLEKQGIKVKIIKPNYQILELIQPVYRIISFSEASSNLANLTGISFGNRVDAKSWEETLKTTRSTKFGHMVQERLSLGSYFLYKENQQEIFIKAQKARRLITNYYNELFAEGDVLIYPATSGIAPKFNHKSTNKVIDYILTGSNLAGNPSITIPLGKKDNLGYNIALDCKLYQDQKLLGIAEYFEELIKGAK